MKLVQQLDTSSALKVGVYKVVVQVPAFAAGVVSRLALSAKPWAAAVTIMEASVTDNLFQLVDGHRSGFQFYFPRGNRIDLKTAQETPLNPLNFHERKGFDFGTNSFWCLICVTGPGSGTAADLYNRVVGNCPGLQTASVNSFQVYKMIPTVAAPKAVAISKPAPTVTASGKPAPRPNPVRAVVAAATKAITPKKKVALASATVPGVPITKDTSPGSKGPSVKSLISDTVSKPQNLAVVGIVGVLGYLIYASAGGS